MISMATLPYFLEREERIFMKLGIVGAGKIVQEFLPFLMGMKDLEVAGILSTPRSLEKARKLASGFGIQQVVTELEGLAAAGADTVYIAVPNRLHYDYARRALELGLHVILEKPMAANAVQAQALADLARQKHLFLFEAITTLYLANYRKIGEWLPRIGRVKLVQSQYSQYSSRYDDFREGKIRPAFDPAQAGGALMDLGLYNVHYVMGLFGTPVKAVYHPNLERGIDTSGVLHLDYGSFQALCVAAKDCQGVFGGIIQGTEGMIQSALMPNLVGKVTLTLRDGTREEFDDGMAGSRMVPEFEAFIKAIREEDHGFCARQLEQSLAVSRVMTEARQGAGLYFPGDEV